MRRGRASITATGVAWGRALGNEANPPDPVARHVLPRPVQWSVRAIERAPGLRWAARLLSAGMVDHVNLRTAAIDALIEDAIDGGCAQLVILGAGLDARAWRMAKLHDVSVFEIDHRDTQRHKRGRVRGLRPFAHDVRFVAVDFERDVLLDKLARAGHQPSTPTVWLWEGVTPYLAPEAIEATLQAIAQASAPSSRLAMTYARRPLLGLPSPAPRLTDAAIRIAFAALGEPLAGLMDPPRAADRVEAVGFTVDADTDQADWGADHALARRLAAAFRSERLLVATKRGGPPA